MSRIAEISRETSETSIAVKLQIDGEGVAQIQTGIGFLDHMLVLLSYHSRMDIERKANSDLDTDEHHVVENN